MELRELVSPSLKDLFIHEIEENILSGKLAVGEKLPTERELAEKMRVSRAVVNSGIAEMAAKGFLEVVPRKGTYVADYKRKGKMETLLSILEYNGGVFDPEMMESISDTARCLQCTFAEETALHRTQEDLADLHRQFAIVRAATGDDDRLVEETFELYHLIAVFTGNIVYPLLFQAFRCVYIPIMAALNRQGLIEERHMLMQRLLDAIERQDAPAAREEMAKILDWSRHSLAAHYTPGNRYYTA